MLAVASGGGTTDGRLCSGGSGRAAWRGRVEISVVAVTLKKKNNKNKNKIVIEESSKQVYTTIYVVIYQNV